MSISVMNVTESSEGKVGSGVYIIASKIHSAWELRTTDVIFTPKTTAATSR